jgi:hypothetical protein
MRLSRIGAEIRSQRYGIGLGVLALLVAAGAPARAFEATTSAAGSEAQALRIAKKADKRSKRALKLARSLSGTPGPRGDAGPAGLKGDPGVQGVQGAQGSPGSDAQFNGAIAGGSLTGTYPNPGIAADTIGSGQLASGAVSTLDIEDGAVTNTKIMGGAVNSSHISDGTVGSADLGAITIRTASGSVTGGGTPQNGNWDHGTVGVECIGDEQRIGGGGYWETGAINDELLIVQSYSFGVKSWYVTGGNDTGSTQTLVAQAVCLAP